MASSTSPDSTKATPRFGNLRIIGGNRNCIAEGLDRFIRSTALPQRDSKAIEALRIAQRALPTPDDSFVQPPAMHLDRGTSPPCCADQRLCWPFPYQFTIGLFRTFPVSAVMMPSCR